MKATYPNLVVLTCYVFYPLINLTFSAFDLSFNKVFLDIFLIATFVLSLLSNKTTNYHTDFYQDIVILLLVLVLAYSSFSATPGLIVLMDVKLFIYLFIFNTLRINNKLPNIEEFVFAGKLLSILIVSEFLLKSLIALNITRPIGSGEVNYDACLICVSLICLLYKNKFKFVDFTLICLGLLTTMSRTGILAGLLIIFTTRKVDYRVKLFFLTLAVSAIYESFSVRDLSFNPESFDRVLMWKAAIELVANNFWIFLIKVGSEDLSLLVKSTPQLTELWTSQASNNGVEGLYPYNFHAFFLRFILSWGMIPFLLFHLMVIRKFLLQNITIEKTQFILLSAVFSFTTGYLYLSNLILPVLFSACIFYNSKKLI